MNKPTGSSSWIALQIFSWIVRQLGSLRLTVGLLGFSIVLVFSGTIAQVTNGIWTVVDQYFRCWFVTVGGWLPVFPGGWLLGTLLLANLIVSHAARIRVQARGPRLLLGMATMVVGLALTFIVITHVFDLDSTQKTINPSKRVT